MALKELVRVALQIQAQLDSYSQSERLTIMDTLEVLLTSETEKKSGAEEVNSWTTVSKAAKLMKITTARIYGMIKADSIEHTLDDGIIRVNVMDVSRVVAGK